MGQTEVLVVAAIVVLVLTAAFLAMAETALTHLPRVKALALKEEGHRGADALVKLLEHREEVLNPILLLVLVCQLVAATLVGLLAESFLGGWGLVLAVVVEVALIFVLAEAAPKTYALQHTEQSALIVAPVARLLARAWPARPCRRTRRRRSPCGTARPASPA
jgi:putative hemolysin